MAIGRPNQNVDKASRQTETLFLALNISTKHLTRIEYSTRIKRLFDTAHHP